MAGFLEPVRKLTPSAQEKCRFYVEVLQCPDLYRMDEQQLSGRHQEFGEALQQLGHFPSHEERWNYSREYGQKFVGDRLDAPHFRERWTW